MEDDWPARLTSLGGRRQVEGAHLFGRTLVGGDEEDSLRLVLEDQKAVKPRLSTITPNGKLRPAPSLPNGTCPL